MKRRRRFCMELLEKRLVLATDLLDGHGIFVGEQFPVGAGPLGIGFADVNADGLQDAITNNSDRDSISVLLATGDGTFQSLGQFDTGDGPVGMAVADINADGIADIGTANYNDDSISILRGNSEGGFQDAVAYATGRHPYSIHFADLNADDILDIVTSNYGDGTLSVLLGQIDGTFADHQAYAAGNTPIATVLGDFNRDGRVDVVAVNQSDNSISLLLGRTNGGFESPVSYSVGSAPRSIDSTDIDGDGILDVLVANESGRTISLFRGLEDGTLQALSTLGVKGTPQSVVASDLDGDEIPDIAVGTRSGVSIMLGQGNRVFSPEMSHQVSGGVTAMHIKEVNGDSSVDIVAVSNFRDAVTVLPGTGNGSFLARKTLQTHSDPRSLVSGDLNGDELMDLVMVHPQLEAISVMIGQSEGRFAEPVSHTVGNLPYSVRLGDLNNDGILDAVCARLSGKATVLMGRGDGTFDPPNDFDAGRYSVSLELEYFNADNVLDLVVANQLGSEISVFIGRGDGTFEGQTKYATGVGTVSVDTGDVNRDGYADIVAVNSSSRSVSLLIGDGEGGFAKLRDTAVLGSGPRAVRLHDVDQDGIADLVVANEHSNSVDVFIGMEDSSYLSPVSYRVGKAPTSIALGDLNADGIDDMVVTHENESVASVLLGLDNGLFSSQVKYPVGTWTFSALLADVNGDDALDLLTTDAFGDEITILENQYRYRIGERANLAVEIVAVPEQVSASQSFSLDYRVESGFRETFSGRRVDTIFLSRDQVADVSDRILGRFQRDDRLGPLTSETYREVFDGDAIAGLESGEYWLVIRANSGNQVFESNYQDNLAKQRVLLDVAVNQLVVGQTHVGHLESGQSLFFQVDFDAGQVPTFKLEGLPSDGFVELYLRESQLPSFDAYDRRIARQFSGSQRIALGTASANTRFFLMVHGKSLANSPAEFRLTASSSTFEIDNVQFGIAGNAGEYTLHASGAGLKDTVVRLIGFDGREIQGITDGVSQDQTELAATFDLSNAPAGSYHVAFVDESGSEVIVMNGLRIEQAVPAPGVLVRLTTPHNIRRGAPFSFTVEWENRSRNNLPVPLLKVGSNAPLGEQRGPYSLGITHTFLGVSTQLGPLTTMRPGQREVATFWGLSDREPGSVVVYLDHLSKNPSAPFVWDSVRSGLKPKQLSDAEYEDVFTALRERVGDTWGDYMAMLHRNAELMVGAWGATADPHSLTALEVQQAWAAISDSVSGTLRSEDNSLDLGERYVQATHLLTGVVSGTYSMRDGSFWFPAMQPGAYELSVDAFSLGARTEITLNDGQSIRGLVLNVSKGVSVEVGVIDGATGNPIEKARIGIIQGQTSVGETDSQGRYMFGGLQRGVSNLSIVVEGYAPVNQSLLITEDHQVLEVVLQPAAQITATVIGIDQLPAPYLYGYITPVGADSPIFSISWDAENGELNLIGVPPGVFDLHLNSDGSEGSVGGVEVSAGQHLDLGTLSLSESDLADGSSPEANASGLAAESAEGEYTSTIIYVKVRPLSVEKGIALQALATTYGLGLPFRGPDFFAVFYSYLFNNYGNRPSYSFRDGHNEVERLDGFRHVLLQKGTFSETFRVASEALTRQLESPDGQKLKDELIAKRVITVPLEQIEIPPELSWMFSIDGNAPLISDDEIAEFWKLPRTIAGGVGHGGTQVAPLYEQQRGLIRTDVPRNYPDTRRITGSIRVSLGEECSDDPKERTRVNLVPETWQLETEETFDFNPGDLTREWLRPFLAALYVLELHDWAYDADIDTVVTSRRPMSQENWLTGDFRPPGPTEHDEARCIGRPTSIDPNDIVGPAGYGPEQYVASDVSLPYMIRFENDQRATAPAAMLQITQALDADLDWETFRLGDIGIGELVLEIPDDTAFYRKRLDATESLGLFLDIAAGIDITKGIVSWQISAVDPNTGDLPEDPLVGFLPPNTNSPEGEGWVSYTVRPKQTASSGDRVDAVASIVFDVNDPILTPPIYHTLDVAAPSSQVVPLPETSPARFLVNWSGHDDALGAGIHSFDVFYRVNGGEALLWIDATTETSAEFVGFNANEYEFLSIARDHVANREGQKEFRSVTFVIAPPWQNPRNWLDVNDDDTVSPLDALRIINELARRETNVLSADGPPSRKGPYFDTTGDDKISPLDALRIINFLGRQISGSADGEATHQLSVALSAVPNRARSEPVPRDAEFVSNSQTGFSNGVIFRRNRAATVAVPAPSMIDFVVREGLMRHGDELLASLTTRALDSIQWERWVDEVIADVH